MTAPIVTAEEVRGLLPIRAGNTSFDTKISLLISVASGAIENAINRELDKRIRVETFRTPDTTQVFYDFTNPTNERGLFAKPRRVRYNLKAFNIDLTAGFDVRYDPNRLYDDSTIVDPTNYSIAASDGYLTVYYSMGDYMDALKVTYTGGFAPDSEGTLTASAPSDIKMACLAQVMHLFGKFTSDNIGKEADTTQGYARKVMGGNKFAVASGLVPEALSLVQRYRAIGIGVY